MSNVFGATGVSGAGFGIFGPEPAPDPNQPAWMTSFQDTLKEIQEKGFQAYAKEINDEKLAEMRKKILDEMGISEEDLAKMSADQRGMIEKMIAEQIREQLVAQAEMRAKGKAGESSLDANGQAAGQVNGLANDQLNGVGGASPLDEATQAALEAKAPNAFGPGMTLIRAMEAANQLEAAEAQKDL
jgi:hypothetical protein